MEPILLAFLTGFILAQAIRLAKNHNIPIETPCTALLYISAAFYWLQLSQRLGEEKCFRTAEVDECREVVKSGTPAGEAKNAIPGLEARARPNQRLKVAFGIDSCFTSSDERACKSFRDGVEKLLYVDEAEWINYGDAARATARQALDVESDSTSLFSVVQLMTLKTMMKVLWPDQFFEHITNEQISTLAHEVNLQWLRSKEGSDNSDDPFWNFDKQTPLKDAVKTVFSDWDETDSKKNPCNLILPGYETMWRVVLRCFVEVVARDHDQTLRAFSKIPTKQQLKESFFEADVPVTAAHIAKEALRLYPPTRRIYREYHDAAGQKTNVSADIEAMQRDPVIWRDHPKLVLPDRWIDIAEGYDHGFMPFGAKPFNCPAKRWKNVPMPFGISMIALLVGALIEATQGKWTIHGNFPDKTHPLDTDREAYGDATLQRL
ncbi:hypothetical protein D6D25_07991 [Aureobasidium pullulans]|nr:hypothetical protein D6D25_07991 [Aureobasidium pullulans]